MIHAVRCPHCQSLSRVNSEVIGRAVVCPQCSEPFTAAADPTIAPVLAAKPKVARRVQHSAQISEPPVLARVLHSGHDHHDVSEGPPPMLVGLALMPVGIPLLWLAVRVATGQAPVFSYAAPVAIALGLCGVGIGVVFAQRFSTATKVKTILALTLMGYMLGGFVFFMKKEWAEAVRKNFSPSKREFRPFTPSSKAYTVSVPWQESTAEEQLPGWELKGFQFRQNPVRDPNDKIELTFEVADGAPPPEHKGLPDDEWFRVARDALVKKTESIRVSETAIKHKELHSGREYALTLPDGATNKHVRIFRIKDRAYYLSVDGVFLARETDCVNWFFDSFELGAKK